MSSSSTKVSAFKIWLFKSSSSFPSSFTLFITFSFFSSRLRRYLSLSSNFLSVSSLSEPVTSFLYLAMNGIVFPSSINFITFFTCQLARFNSFSSVLTIIKLLPKNQYSFYINIIAYRLIIFCLN